MRARIKEDDVQVPHRWGCIAQSYAAFVSVYRIRKNKCRDRAQDDVHVPLRWVHGFQLPVPTVRVCQGGTGPPPRYSSLETPPLLATRFGNCRRDLRAQLPAPSHDSAGVLRVIKLLNNRNCP